MLLLFEPLQSAVVLALAATNRASKSTLSKDQQIRSILNTVHANERKEQEIAMEYTAKAEGLRDEFYRDTAGIDPIQRNMLWAELQNKLATEQQKRQARLDSELNPVGKIKLKTTVILTSVSLMGQWEDEARKHAPGKQNHLHFRPTNDLLLEQPSLHLLTLNSFH